jgi:hypothetical protein
VLLRTPKATILVRSGDAFNEFCKAKIAEALPWMVKTGWISQGIEELYSSEVVNEVTANDRL